MALKFLNNGYFAGKVGIGTDSPSSNLDIEDASGVTIDINSSSGDGMFRFQDDGTTKWAIGRDNTQQNFVFSNSAGLASDNVLTLAHSTGNVGIGTTSPSEKLEVDGRIKLQTSAGSLTMKETGSGSVALASSATIVMEAPSNFRLKTGSSLLENFTVLSTGNVGIGETNPGNTLHVKKNATIGVITSPTVANAGFRVQDSGANMYVDGNSFVIDTSGYLTTTGSNDFDIGTNSTSRIKIKGGGNVGIGILDPLAKLHIDVVDEDNQPGFKLTKVSDSGENAMEVHHGTSSVLRGIADFTNDNGSVMFLRGDGNVGIGTTRTS